MTQWASHDTIHAPYINIYGVAQFNQRALNCVQSPSSAKENANGRRVSTNHLGLDPGLFLICSTPDIMTIVRSPWEVVEEISTGTDEDEIES
jgi:hypothetical protein